MPRKGTHSDDEDDDWDDDDSDDAEDEDTTTCPHCGQEIYDDAVRCPHCEAYISAEDSDRIPERKPWWIIVGVVICLYIVYRWIVG